MGEEVKQHQGLQHTKASTGHVHPPGCKKSDRQRARGRGQGEVAYSLREELRRGGCGACERGQAFEEFQIQFHCKILSPNYITSWVTHGFGESRVVGYLPCV